MSYESRLADLEARVKALEHRLLTRDLPAEEKRKYARMMPMTFGEAKAQAPEITFWFWLLLEHYKVEWRENSGIM